MIHRDPWEALDISNGTTIVIPMASQIRYEYTISSFQLVPETTAGAASLPDSDSDKDTL
ncbi:hypothetical protein YC2023_056733 [Brassica napus]